MNPSLDAGFLPLAADGPPSVTPPSPGLVRADLAFTWPAWNPDESPKPQPPQELPREALDDMLDLETPSRPTTSQVKRVDPLPRMLNGLFDTPKEPATLSQRRKEVLLAKTPDTVPDASPRATGTPPDPKERSRTATPKSVVTRSKSATGSPIVDHVVWKETTEKIRYTEQNKNGQGQSVRSTPLAETPQEAKSTPGSTENQPPSPGYIWKQAITGDSPPAIVRTIVTSLHRSLSSKEDAVRGIATEYKENALRLIDGMNLRHSLERKETLESHADASRAILAAFIAAEKDVACLVNQIAGIDVGSEPQTGKRPSFLKKLRLVIRLYEAQLTASLRIPTVVDSVANPDMPEAEESGDAEGGKLVDGFRVRLYSKVRRPETATVATRSKIREDVDSLLRDQLPGQGSQRPKRKTGEELLEEMLDRTISSFRERLGPEVFQHIVRNEEGSESADPDDEDTNLLDDMAGKMEE
ncbi:hypothetical protein QBC47DRAFT_167246 [Echria macrotheca]|uniref:Uncharacterized protein n=1 Tax=Echria macrotheca TaxID=438768 RepID=A0AAJ0BGQ4_9PEZI|nr:hypothetical protein QBC47DRAFT_167246 [Echria macrotheca]